MIFELFVSSARICEYISEIPGACAVNGIACSNITPTAHANAFTTVPPRQHNPQNSPEFAFSLLVAARQYTPRALVHAIRCYRISRTSGLVTGLLLVVALLASYIPVWQYMNSPGVDFMLLR